MHYFVWILVILPPAHPVVMAFTNQAACHRMQHLMIIYDPLPHEVNTECVKTEVYSGVKENE